MYVSRNEGTVSSWSKWRGVPRDDEDEVAPDPPEGDGSLCGGCHREARGGAGAARLHMYSVPACTCACYRGRRGAARRAGGGGSLAVSLLGQFYYYLIYLLIISFKKIE